MSEVRVEGLNKLVRALSKAGVDAEDQKALMHEIGSLVVDAANPPVMSGHLKSTLRAGKGKTKSVVRAGSAKYPYAGVVHYGWPKHNIKAQPFLTLALTAKQTAIISALEAGVDKLLSKNNL